MGKADCSLSPPCSRHGPRTFAVLHAGTWKIIDFGLARRYTSEETGAVLPQRPDAAFRGSTTYASVHAHAEQDLGRRDDLWSWLYCLVELLDGERCGLLLCRGLRQIVQALAGSGSPAKGHIRIPEQRDIIE